MALAGAAGDDEWGRWLRDRLEREGVDLRYFELLEGEQTPIAFASFDAEGNPSFQIYGDAVEIAVASLAPRLDEVMSKATALVYSSTTLATPGEREVTLRARELALEHGARVCLDPNIRPNRWGGDVWPGGRGLTRPDRGLDRRSRQPRGGDGDRRDRRFPGRGGEPGGARRRARRRHPRGQGAR